VGKDVVLFPNVFGKVVCQSNLVIQWKAFLFSLQKIGMLFCFYTLF